MLIQEVLQKHILHHKVVSIKHNSPISGDPWNGAFGNYYDTQSNINYINNMIKDIFYENISSRKVAQSRK